MTARLPVSVVLAALVVSVAVSCSAPGAASSPTPAVKTSASRAAAELPAPTKFWTSLEHTEVKRPDDLVDWRTDWVLHWTEVPDATGYLIRFSTSEGRGGRERRVTATELKVDVAAGTSPVTRLEVDREAQLTMTASQLLVSVAAIGSTGGESPAVGWYRVGEAPSNGVPVANADPEEHG